MFCGWASPFVCGPTQINKNSNNINNIELYPNPTFTEITINLTSSETKTYIYNITDLAGKQIKKVELSGNKNNSLNVSELTQGVYIFNVLDAGRIIGVKKFVKE
ncbi:MAG: T9SS type A sorting domain-containing protein [Sphingobacteriaceae bacterium]|nr:T9SS type A sorting domain-containing protein [Sphingobacteriaceae bacterium]